MLSINDITEEIAINMLKYECRMRNSDEVQIMYDENKINVEDYVQKETLKKFSYLPNQFNLNEYRKIGTKFYDNQNVMESAFFLKYNIIEDVPNVLYDTLEDAKLVKLNKENTNLFNFISDKPLVILAGSIT